MFANLRRIVILFDENLQTFILDLFVLQPINGLGTEPGLAPKKIFVSTLRGKYVS